MLHAGSCNRPAYPYHCGVAVGVVQERSGTIIGAHANGYAAASVVLILIDVCTILDVRGNLIPAQSNPSQVFCAAQEPFLILSLSSSVSVLTNFAQGVQVLMVK